MKTRTNLFGFGSGWMLIIVVWCTPVKAALAADNPVDPAVEVTWASPFYQPLMWVGETPPTDEEDALLKKSLLAMRDTNPSRGATDVEAFISAHPNSAWVPSLEANLGRYYFEHGLYGPAGQHWANAWQATHTAKDGSAKKIADFTFTYWTKLLLGLGKMDTLKPLYLETEGRVFDGGSLQQIISITKENYRMMLLDPQAALKCGSVALINLGRSIQGLKFDLPGLDQASPPPTGFSLSDLTALGQKNGINVTAIQWGASRDIPVPSVMHTKDNHYIAITKESKGYYEVLDPVYGEPHWLARADIQQEASGYFLIPNGTVPQDSKLVLYLEAAHIYGTGIPTSSNLDDSTDGCGNTICCATSSSNSPGEAPNNSSCPYCVAGTRGVANSGDGGTYSGMPQWSVSEPYINLWLRDEPMGYQPGAGDRISFQIDYKQRETRTISTNFYSLGPQWDFPWLTYVENTPGTAAIMLVPGGGQRTYTADGISVEYYSHTVLSNINVGAHIGNVVSYPHGAMDIYGFVPTNGAGPLTIDGYPIALLTKKTDAFGHTTQFVYQETNSLVTLQAVIDPDGRTNTLSYTNALFPNLITGVTDPFGNTASFQYDTNGVLTNVTDVVGLSSSFAYDSQGWLTNLTTPYGQTTFDNVTNSNVGTGGTEFDGNNLFELIRACRVVDPIGGTNIYMLRQNSASNYNILTGSYQPFLPTTYASNIVPSNVPTSTLDNYWINGKDSFHWGPRQAIALPTNLFTFASNDFIKAGMNHWLAGYNAMATLSQTIDMTQDPSPDGVNPGQTTWYDYDGKNASFEEGTDSQPSLVAKVLPDGTTSFTWYQRDSLGRPTTVVNTYSTGFGASPLTRSNIFVYDANNVDLDREINALGVTNVAYSYNVNHQMLTMTNALGEVMKYTYDTVGRLTSTTTPAGLVTTNIYFSSGFYSNWPVQTIDIQIGRTNTYAYTNDQVYIQTNELGLVTTNTWDALGRLHRVDYPDATFVTNTYNKLDFAQVVDRMGFTNSFGYDALRHKIAETNALGNVTQYDYCTCGALNSIEDALNNYTLFYYDNAGRRTNIVYADGYSVFNSYNLLGQVTSTSDSAGVSVTNWFNNQGLKYAISNYFGQVSLASYDILDRVTNYINVNEVAVTSTYDILNRTLTWSYPDGGVERYGYTFDIAAATSYTNQLLETTRYYFDAAGRKTAETNANLEGTEFTYNPVGNLLTLTDGKSQTTTWHYDIYGLTTNKLDAASNQILVYRYDADQRLTNRFSISKGNTFYYYDKVANLTNVVYSNSPAISLAYDTLNRLTTMIDGVGATYYNYDAVGQLLSAGGLWPDDTVSYSYSNRERTGMSLLQPTADSWTQSYAYDSARRLTNTASSAGVFGYVYDGTRQLKVKDLILPNGAYITNSYDGNARMLSTALINSSLSTLNSNAYGYNVGNQRTNQTFFAGNTMAYAYDNVGQLTSAIGKESGGSTNRLQEQLEYAYDAAHNLNIRTNNALVETFNANNLNELSTITRSGTLTVAGTTTSPASSVTVNSSVANRYTDATFALGGFTVTNGNNTFTAVASDSYGRGSTNSVTVNLPATNNYSYDLNGNLLSDGIRGFAYDDENELTSVTVTNSWMSQFVYDGKMRMRIRKEFGWFGAWLETNEVHYIYDGTLVIQERDNNNLPQVAYTRGRDLIGSLRGVGGIGGLLSRTDETRLSATDAYYHCDGNGNITMLINALQAIVARYEYDPYGNVLSQSGSLATANVYQFSSKEYHRQSGTICYLCRWYDPHLQRWLNRDPMNEIGGVNLFCFVDNQPNDEVDPSGLLGLDDLLGIGGTLTRYANNPLVRWLGYASIFINAAQCVENLAKLRQPNPCPSAVSAAVAQANCENAARDALTACLGVLGNAIGGTMAGVASGGSAIGGGAAIGGTIGNILGYLLGEVVSNSFLDSTVCPLSPVAPPPTVAGSRH